MGVAEPGVRPPGAASTSAKSIQEDEIPLAVMVGRMFALDGSDCLFG